MPIRPLAGVATLVLASFVAAQRPVVTVGGNNPNFADLPAAVQNAVPGSIIDVRPGIYTGFTTSKPLHIVLDNATILPAPASVHTIQVTNLIGTDPFVIKGDNAIIAPSLLASLRINNCVASVVIESLTVIGATAQPAVDIFSTGSVHVARSIFGGYPALQAQFTNLICNESVIGNSIGPGAIVSDAYFDVSRSIFISANEPALRVFDSVARLASDTTGSMLVFGTPTVPVSAFEATDSTVYWDPSRFTLLPANGAPAFSAVAATQVIEEVPMINAGPATVGGTGTVRMAQATPAPGMISVGLLRPSPIVLGDVLIYPNPATYGLAAAGIVDQNGLIATFPIPNDPTLRGTIMVFQGITFLGNGVSPVSSGALWYVQ